MVKGIAKLITKETTRQQWALIGFFLLAFFVQGAAFYLVASFLLNQPVREWMPWFIIASLVLLFIAIVVLSLAANSDKRITQATQQFFTKEVGYLEMANKRAQRLQAMASTLRATLSFERVVEEALDICSMELEEMGTPRQSLVAAVYLFRGQVLYPVATRLFIGNDMERVIPGRAGIVGQALSEAEPAVTHDPRNDPELSKFVAFQNCVTAVCIPLRAGFQIFGAMVFGSGTAVELTEGHFELFNAVGDQAVIALQNAQLYQQLTAEKQRLIEA
ncbi:MAG: GAF domain-containing protein, partial [Anaerolineales bacterium]|nr:GAF domain-containing protein [Anaerolineales bacterium]